MQYGAVIFDMDGTLVDSEAIALEAAQRAVARFGLHVRDGFFHSLIGSDFATTQQRLAEEFGADLVEPLDTAWGAEYAALRDKGMPLKPGVLELLDRVAASGVPRAVCTSSRMAGAQASLTAAGIIDRFDSLVTRDCVTHAKPHPSPM